VLQKKKRSLGGKGGRRGNHYVATAKFLLLSKRGGEEPVEKNNIERGRERKGVKEKAEKTLLWMSNPRAEGIKNIWDRTQHYS